MNNYQIYPVDISFSIVFGAIYGMVIAFFLDKTNSHEQLMEEIDLELQANLEQMEAFNEELIAQNNELEEFAHIITDKEKELREIINLIPSHVYIKNIHGQFLLANKAYAEFLDRTPRQIEGYSQSSLEKLTPEETKIFSKMDRDVIDNYVTYSYVEKKVKAGKELSFQVTKMPINLKNGTKEILVIAHDITKIKQMENKIKQTNAQLKSDNKKLVELNKKSEKLAGNLEQIINLITNSKETHINEEKYLIKVLDLTMSLIKNADIGTLFKFENGKVKFLKAYGCDIDVLNNKEYNAENFESVASKNSVFIEEDESKHATVGLYYGSNQIGGINLSISSDQVEGFSEEELRLIKSINILVNDYYSNKKMIEVQNNIQNNIIISLVKMLELHDLYTKGHSESVGELSKELAISLELSDEEVNSAYWAGVVHDIGKILVDKKILNKPGKLTYREFMEIKKHPKWGFEVLNKSDELKDIARYVLHHHERYDGNGYPDGLKGEEIPTISQIITVVDSWHTMRSKRAYREPLDVEIAISELIFNRGTQFNKEFVDVFINDVLKKRLPEGTINFDKFDVIEEEGKDSDRKLDIVDEVN